MRVHEPGAKNGMLVCHECQETNEKREFVEFEVMRGFCFILCAKCVHEAATMLGIRVDS